MYLKKFLALLLVAALTVSLLAACSSSIYSGKLGIAINDAQAILDLSHSGQLDQALRRALANYQAGEDLSTIRNRVIEELGLGCI